MKNNESSFRSEIISAAKRQGFFLLDIPDEIKRLLPALCIKDRKIAIRYITQKPCDLCLLKDGAFTALELKYVTSSFTFAFSKVETHQVEALMNVEEHGGKGFILVAFKTTLTTKQKLKYSQVNHLMYRAFVIPIKKFRQAQLRGQKSISLLELEKNFTEMKQEQGYWKLNF